MKKYTATELNKEPKKVFMEAFRKGVTIIEHDRFPGKFVLAWKEDEEDENSSESSPPR